MYVCQYEKETEASLGSEKEKRMENNRSGDKQRHMDRTGDVCETRLSIVCECGWVGVQVGGIAAASQPLWASPNRLMSTMWRQTLSVT